MQVIGHVAAQNALRMQQANGAERHVFALLLATSAILSIVAGGGLRDIT